MSLARIRREIAAAQQYFDYVEGHPTVEGGVMALIALETSRHVYILAVFFPESFPNAMPEVHVRKPALASSPAPVPRQPDLLSASAHVEPRPARLDVRNSASRKVAGQVRGVPADGSVARGRDCTLAR